MDVSRSGQESAPVSRPHDELYDSDCNIFLGHEANISLGGYQLVYDERDLILL